MTKLSLGVNAYDRSYAKQPEIKLVNRFFESNPTNMTDGVSLLSRPATSLLATVGAARGRASFSLEGAFNDALFVVSGTELWRLNKDLTKQRITGSLAATGTPIMAFTGGRLFIADGVKLQYYDGDEVSATATLTLTGNAVANETVTIGAQTYTFVSTLTAANQVLVGLDADASASNLAAAINDTTGEGTVYGTGTTTNVDVTAVKNVSSSITVTAKLGGSAANTTSVAETMTNASWNDTVLSGGVDGSLKQVTPPGSESFVSIAVLAKHVIAVVANSQQWFFIKPGTTVIEALNFYEAEQLPDDIISVRTVGDNVVFFGGKSSEFWYANGGTDADDPFSRNQGIAFSRGIVEGTDVLIDDKLFVVGDDGKVYNVSEGIQRVSKHDIEQKIRTARKIDREAS